jgi:hypothetical protein
MFLGSEIAVLDNKLKSKGRSSNVRCFLLYVVYNTL